MSIHPDRRPVRARGLNYLLLGGLAMALVQTEGAGATFRGTTGILNGRVTDAERLPVVEMVLTGKVNQELVALLNARDAGAVGVSGSLAGKPFSAHADQTVIAAGGIVDAQTVKAALALGASAVQVGTTYLLCHETTISATYRASDLGAAKAEVEVRGWNVEGASGK